MADVYKRTGSTFFQATLYVHGERKRVSTKKRSRREAQKAADDLELRLNQALIASKSIGLITATERFFVSKSLKPKTIENYKLNLANIYSVFGDAPLASISQKSLGNYVTERLKHSGPVMIRRDLAFLSSLFNSAKHWDEAITSNPVRDFDKTGLPEAKSRTRWLRTEEVQALVRHCSQDYQRLFILMAVGTGMRTQEILQLRWSEIDFEACQIMIDSDRSKNHQGRVVPILVDLRDTLIDTKRKQAFDAESPWVFVNPSTGKPLTTVKKFWCRIVKEADIKNIHVHDLRHTYASWAKQQGIDDITIMDIMGHKTPSMVRRYAHSSLESLHRAVKRMSFGTLFDTGSTD